MELLTTILLVAGAGLILWFTYQNVQKNRQAFTRQNTSRSIFTLGILALILIGVISALAMLLRHT
jgi:uncharacterized membrane protein YidH (DUF202 family)